jgi:hypothetical protein
MHGKLTQVSTAWRVLHQLAALQQWTILIHRKFAKLRFLTVRVFPNGLKCTSRTPQDSNKATNMHLTGAKRVSNS